jgi:cytochrome P450
MSGAMEYGDVVYYRMGPMHVYLVNDPDGIKHVLQDNQRNYVKGIGYEALEPALGRGLLLSEGDFWRRQRRLAQPAFHRQRMAGLADVMAGSTSAMLERWSKNAVSGEPLDIAAEMMRLTLGIVSRTLLGFDVSGEADKIGQAMARALEETNRRALTPIRLDARLPTRRNLAFKRDIKTLDTVVYRIIEERRKRGGNVGPKGDLLDMFMEVRDEDTGESMNDKQLRDEVMTMFLAGHETTANLLAWTFMLLSKNPGIARKVRAEAEEVLGGRVPGFEDAGRLRYTAMVLEEALRLFPPAWVIAREALGDDEVCGYRVPKGSIIVLCSYVVHRLPKLWPNPEGFDPERFNPDTQPERHKYSYFPFGGGPRVCIGSGFAMMEAQLIVAMALSRYRLDLVPGHPIVLDPLITLRPKHGIRMTVNPN